MSTDTVAVIGAGTMGSGIAQKLAQEGSHVLLVDRTDADVARGRERIETMLAEGVERKIFTPERAAQVLARVEGTLDFGRLAECDLVIEAVFENLEVKRDLFRRLGECTRPETVLATNTSSFYVRQVAEVTKNPERVLGLHYFYHPAKNRLVEVVPHEGTDPAATRRAWAFQERVGKTPIASADAPGFVVNRFFVPWLNEAVRILDEGVADIPTIEAAAKEAFGIGMGPFQLMNVTGVPIALHAATTLGRELGPFYAPGDRLRAQVESKELWPLEGEAGDQGREEARERLLGTVFHVAAALVDEDVSTIEDTDIGARVGLRWRVGPFELANEVGVGEAARMARRAVEAYGLPAPKALTEQAASGQPFTIRVCALACEGGVATITINRPDALNALNETVVAQLTARFEEANQAADVHTILLRGAGKAFVAGADIKFFVDKIQADALADIVAFTEAGQSLFAGFAASSKVVIAYLDGLSLGGGSELALACDYVVATRKGSLGFPETGIGIYPGLGGTQRLPRRVGRGLARYLINSGQTVSAEDALAVGLIDRLIEPHALEATVAELTAAGKPGDRTPGNLPARFAPLAQAFDHPVQELLAGEHASDDPTASKLIKRLGYKAPVALALADELIASALEQPLADGLRAEVERLPRIFSTQDALIGLSAVLARSRPSYVGA